MIGVSSPEFSAYQFEEVMEEVSKKFEHWEIFAEAEHSLRAISARFVNVMSKYNMSYSIHAPISDINIASLNERIREDSTIEILSTMEQAVAMNIELITIHPGIYSFSVPYMEEKSIEQAKKSLRTIDRVSAEYGVTIALENMPSFPFMLGQSVEEMKDLFDGTNLAMCLDIGHANTTKTIQPMIGAFKDRIVNVHIHDNHGGDDEHLTLGEGNIDFKKAIKDLGNYEGNFIIESKSFPSAVESQDYLKKLF
jgi:sugar phosphate isomerase/epimerase